MNWAAINAISEVIGTVAIIATLIYVAAQIRQSTSIARATIIHETNSDSMRLSECIAMDAELRNVVEFLSSEYKALFSTPEARQWWHNDVKQMYRPSFARKVDKYIDAVQ